MNLKQLGGWGQSRSTTSDESALPAAERCLTLLADGAAAGVPEFDADCYRGFRAKVDELGRQLRDRLPDADKLALIGSILREFESYRNESETALREQLAAWRIVVTSLFSELIGNLGVDPASKEAAPLLALVKQLRTGGEIDDWRQKLELFLHPMDGKGPAFDMAAKLRAADCSTANDNAAGLRAAAARSAAIGECPTKRTCRQWHIDRLPTRS